MEDFWLAKTEEGSTPLVDKLLLLHHDNAPATLPCLFVNFFPKTILQRCPSIHIRHSVFFFVFPKIKRTLKGSRCFTSIDDIKSAMLKKLKIIPKIKFEKCFDNGKKHRHTCILSNSYYFEDENINLDK